MSAVTSYTNAYLIKTRIPQSHRTVARVGTSVRVSSAHWWWNERERERSMFILWIHVEAHNWSLDWARPSVEKPACDTVTQAICTQRWALFSRTQSCIWIWYETQWVDKHILQLGRKLTYSFAYANDSRTRFHFMGCIVSLLHALLEVQYIKLMLSMRSMWF